MAGYVYKPQTRKGPVFLSPTEGSAPPQIRLPDGRVVDGVRADQRGGVYKGHEGYQWVFDNDVLGQQGAELMFNGTSQSLGNSNMSYRGNELGALSEDSKGAIGSAGGFSPGQIGSGFYPGYIPFPMGTQIAGANYDPIESKKFAKQFGKFNRKEIKKNAGLANELALDQLDLELQGLNQYAPAATQLRVQENSKLMDEWRNQTKKNEGLRTDVIKDNAKLSRDLTGEDNTFNQAERTKQVDGTLPELRGDIDGQRQRANDYASGRVPDAIIDRGLEISNRSASADRSAVGGFGSNSGAARNISDIMAAKERIGLSQYGDSLLASNAQTASNLLLAPTSYSQAGSKVNIEPNFPTGANISAESGISSAPTVSPAQLASQNLGMYNASTTLSVGQALSSDIQQSQFGANLEQRTQEFNAGVANQFALQGHQYDVGYAGAVAGAAQTDLNTTMALEQQGRAQQIFQDSQGTAQNNANWQAGAAIVGTGASLLGSGGSSGSSSPNVGNPIPSSGGMSEDAGYSGGYDLGSGGSPGSGQVYLPSTNQTLPSGGSYGGGSGSVVLPQGDQMPSGYTGVATTPDGGTVSVPTSEYASYRSAPQKIPGGLDSVTGPIDNAISGGLGTVNRMAEGGLKGEYSQGNISRPDTMAAKATGYSAVTGVPALDKHITEDRLQTLSQSGAAAMNTAGVYDKSGTGSTPIGYDNNGKAMYGNTELMKSDNGLAGQNLVNELGKVVEPFKVLDGEDKNKFNEIAKIAANPTFMAQLAALHQSGDKEGFINTVLGQFKQPLINEITDDPKGQAGLGAAYNGYQLYSNWDRMSTAQKGLGLAATGLQSFKYASGENLADKLLIAPQGKGEPSLTVGGALNLMASGINAYSLTKNWDQLNKLQKIAGASGSITNIAKLSQDMGLLGSGTQGAAVPGITTDMLQSQGWSSSPAQGIGAVTGKAGSTVPAGYQAVGNSADGGVIAIPSSNATSFSGTTSAIAGAGAVAGGIGAYQSFKEGDEVGGSIQASGAAASTYTAVTGGAGAYAGLATGIGGAGLVAGGAIQVSKGWGTGGKAGAINGAVGGSAMAAGLMALGLVNPFLLGAVVLVSIAGNVIKTGKNEDQIARDGIRTQFQRNGLVDNEYNMTLADGSKFNLGMDGRGGKHAITNPDKLAEGHKGKIKELNSYDIDYTNDLDYMAGMGGVTLSRLLSGGKGQAIDQLGNQLGNGALGGVGFGKDMSTGNFESVRDNMRSIYAQSGIKNKEDGYQLANMMYSEGRLDESEVVSMHQSLNMIFDKDGYSTAQKLMGGRQNGINVAFGPEPSFDNGAVPIGKSKVTAKADAPKSKAVTEPISMSKPNSLAGVDQSELVPYKDVQVDKLDLEKDALDKDKFVMRNRQKYSKRSSDPSGAVAANM